MGEIALVALTTLDDLFDVILVMLTVVRFLIVGQLGFMQGVKLRST